MASEAPIEKVVVEVQGKKIVLDPVNMKYNENSIADYMNQEYGWIDYLGKQLEFAQKEVLLAELEYDAIFAEKFMEAKDKGLSDTYCKSFATANSEVKEAKIKFIEKKEIVGHLRAHLKAWDRNHENVQNRGHSLRAEMKVLSRDIYPTSEEDMTGTYEDFLKNN